MDESPAARLFMVSYGFQLVLCGSSAQTDVIVENRIAIMDFERSFEFEIRRRHPDLWHSNGGAKKRAAVSGGFEVDNREASNRVDRSHSVSKRGRSSHKGESLIDRK